MNTRSRTGKLPPTRLIKHYDNEDDAGFTDSGSRASSEAPEKPPAKRAKTVKKGKQAQKAPSRRKRGRLSALPSMPLDILFEIFGHLPPADLIQLTRVTKAFRQVLMSRRSAFLWKESYQLVPQVPPCPDDMSEPAWAHLLFGGAYCYTCGAKPVSRILFELRRRVCRSCMSDNLVGGYDAYTAYPPLTYADMDLVSYVCDNGSKRRWYGYYRWTGDLECLQREITTILGKYTPEQAETCEKELSAFKTERRNLVAAKKKHAVLCTTWVADKFSDRSDELLVIKSNRFEKIKARLLELGHVENDINGIRYHREVNVAKPMSDRVWARIRPILEPVLTQCKADRLDQEVRRRRVARRECARAAYLEYLQSLPVRIVPHLPPDSEVLSWPAVVEAIEADEPVSPELQERLKAVVLGLESDIMAVIQIRANTLLALIPGVKNPSSTSPALSVDNLLDNNFHTGPAFGLGLATTQFTCGSIACYQTCTGFGMMAHRCLSSQDGTYTYIRTAHDVVLQLLGLLGMDPANTTAMDLDRLDARFVCMNCDVRPRWCGGGMVTGRLAMPWRTCTTHNKDAHGALPSQYQLLTSEQIQLARTREGAEYGGQWGCGHCNFLLSSMSQMTVQWHSRSTVLRHLAEIHSDVGQPTLGIDYFHNLRYSMPGCMPATIEMDPQMPTVEAAVADILQPDGGNAD